MIKFKTPTYKIALMYFYGLKMMCGNSSYDLQNGIIMGCGCKYFMVVFDLTGLYKTLHTYIVYILPV